MLTFGWAFSFLDRPAEAQASLERPAQVGRSPGCQLACDSSEARRNLESDHLRPNGQMRSADLGFYPRNPGG